MLDQILHIFHNLPDYLQMWANQYGTGLYLIFAAILSCETGLVITPLLPGDSLLFATGAVLSLNVETLNLPTMATIMICATFAGDTTNYFIGQWAAPKLFRDTNSRWLNRKHLTKTQEFYNKHGGKTIILARFVAIVRSNFKIVILAIIVISLLPLAIEFVKSRRRLA